jgi:hypothetical protein
MAVVDPLCPICAGVWNMRVECVVVADRLVLREIVYSCNCGIHTDVRIGSDVATRPECDRDYVLNLLWLRRMTPVKGTIS